MKAQIEAKIAELEKGRTEALIGLHQRDGALIILRQLLQDVPADPVADSAPVVSVDELVANIEEHSG